MGTERQDESAGAPPRRSKTRERRANRLAAAAAGLLAVTAAGAEPPPPEAAIGDVASGSRAAAVHRIPLLDEEGQEIYADDDPAVPFSPRQTCASRCHDYETIRHGWHFSAAEQGAAGRPGHPWLLVDPLSRTQLPLSHRAWPGAWRPADAGLDDWEFVKRFARQSPGGGPGHWDQLNDPRRAARVLVSGPLEINCLSCHDGDPGHDQAEYGAQAARENFRWAAAATAAFATVHGSAKDMPDSFDYLMPEPPSDVRLEPPRIAYRPEAFDQDNRVLFDIRRRPPPERCWFCHSATAADPPRRFLEDPDVHLAAGLGCVDCHRHGVDHRMVRGVEGESEDPALASLTCRGCHYGPSSEGGRRWAGRLGAPRPAHAGLPPLHLERLSCTACHSGPRLEDGPRRVQTALAHGLGARGAAAAPASLPHVVAPVLAPNAAGRIAPHYAVWPAFWGRMDEQRAVVRPIPLGEAQAAVRAAKADAAARRDGWPRLDKSQIAAVLGRLAAASAGGGRPAYVAGGLVFRLNDQGRLESQAGQGAAQPYLWPLAHDVRPAAQALGAGGCQDCHGPQAPFFWSLVRADSPAQETTPPAAMHQWLNVDASIAAVWARLWPLRAWFKGLMAIASAVVLAALVRSLPW